MRRRPGSASPDSPFLRHRVRQRVEDWERIGASGQVLSWIRRGVRVQWRAGVGPPRTFNHGVSMADATPDQLRFMEGELPRLLSIGAWELGSENRWVSRLFLVPKGAGDWRMVVDLRFLNSHCRQFSMKFETLRSLRTMAKQNDYMISMDLRDGFYAIGIHPEFRDYFTVNYRGTLYRLACLPMGWCASPYVFHTVIKTVVDYLRSPIPIDHRRPTRVLRKRKGRQREGVRLLPFVDDFLFLRQGFQNCLRLRDAIDSVLSTLGLQRHTGKGVWDTPTQCIEHLGLTVDSLRMEFRAPPAKLQRIAALAKDILVRAARHRRWVSARLLASLAGKAQFLYLAIPPARFYLRELHTVLASKNSWGARVQLSKQLIRDLEWWRGVPSQHNGRPIQRELETAYLHCDSSQYGWGAVLNGHLESRGFWYDTDREAHITYKELKAVRQAVRTFLPHLSGRRVLLHEDNQAVVSVLTHLTSRSPSMMTELRKLWWILDSHEITIVPQYIRSAANIWADRLSRETDHGDWQLQPRVFRYLDRLWGPHSVDRFASMENAQLPRYNSKWLDPCTEAVDALRLPDDAWARERNWCNPPWELLPDLAAKLRRSGAEATVVAPLWGDRAWFQSLLEAADDYVVYPPSRDLFFPGRRGSREGVGPAAWSAIAMHLPSRPGGI